MSASQNSRVGKELAGYRLESLLGRGGMGVVYRARDLALDRDVALKLLAPHLAEDVSFQERFLTESRVAACFGPSKGANLSEGGARVDPLAVESPSYSKSGQALGPARSRFE